MNIFSILVYKRGNRSMNNYSLAGRGTIPTQTPRNSPTPNDMTTSNDMETLSNSTKSIRNSLTRPRSARPSRTMYRVTMLHRPSYTNEVIKNSKNVVLFDKPSNLSSASATSTTRGIFASVDDIIITRRTRVACIYCCDVYSANRAEFDMCDDDGECGTLLCMRCEVASVVPIVTGSVLYGLSEEALMKQIYKWHEDGFGPH